MINTLFGRILIAGIAFYRRAPPLLGERMRDVLIEQVALTAEELESLKAERIIACAKPGSAP